MNTITLHVSEKTSKKEVEEVIKKSAVKKGDTIKVYKGDLDTESLLFIGFLVILAGALLFSKKYDKSIEKIFSGDKSVKEIEELIEAKAGVKIDIEEKPDASGDPIDGVFGIWENRKNFDKEKFRDNAWRKIS